MASRRGVQHDLAVRAGDKVELVAEKLGDEEAELRELLGRELVVLGVTSGGGRVYLKRDGRPVWARGDQVRKRR